MKKNYNKKSSFFVSGARPFILWILGASLAWQFLIAPMLFSILGLFDIHLMIPSIDTEQLIYILLSMLGLSGIRTYEKKQGISN